jgi:ABC-type glycerol-3-phosphate transport system permease component
VGRYRKQDFIITAFLLVLAIIWVIPILNAFKLSLDTNGWGNYMKVLTFELDGTLFLPKMFLNSIIVVGTSIFLVLAITATAAYSFSKMKFPGSDAIYLSILAFYAVPIITILLPTSTIIQFLGLRNTYAAMIIPMVTINIPIALLIFKNYFDSISSTYIEAAQMDGCSNFKILFKIILPMSTPALVNVLIVLFLLTWNDYAIPLMFTSENDLFTLTLAPGFFSMAMNRSEVGPLYACIILIAIPTLIVYLLLQKKITEGAQAGGIKG